MNPIRSICSRVLTAAVWLAFAPVAQAQTWPAKPVKIVVPYAPGGAGTTPHFVSEALGIAAGANFMHIPFKGAGEATMAMLSGTIDFQIASTPGVMGNVKGGKARLLAVSGTRRLSALPDVPTFAEAGLKHFGLINFTGLWAPKGTPQAVIDRLQKEVAANTAFERQ